MLVLGSRHEIVLTADPLVLRLAGNSRGSGVYLSHGYGI